MCLVEQEPCRKPAGRPSSKRDTSAATKGRIVMDTSNRSFALSRRTMLAALAAWPLSSSVPAAARKPMAMQVWKDPNCGCCKDWIAHLEKNGFVVTVSDAGNNAARARLGMPKQFGSCHTGLVQGYVIEGHVPAADVLRLLKERPQSLGLAVPGMPVGSPGMDGPVYGARRDAYRVLLIQKDGSSKVFSSYA
jgi:hypothetical protein